MDLKMLEVVLAILLIIAVLLQNKSTGLNLTTMGSGVAGGMKKRGAEKFLFVATIVLSAAFILNAVVLFVLGK
ncbi:MAG: preprotein translocase subunit SecG [Candidatus Gracilibacteria bacterium]|nr:preprotein translocase subunit SecG [Candidatus Gracilibacteria bacterium]